MTDMNAKLKNRIDELIREDVLSGTSLIMSIFGDCIFQRGGVISLASLIQLMDVFGFNERSVRTAVCRLGQNGWLTSEKIGRTSYYRVTESSRKRFYYCPRQDLWLKSSRMGPKMGLGAVKLS